MDNQRVFIWAALALVLYLNFMAWQKDYAPPPLPTSACDYNDAVCDRYCLPPANDTLPELPSGDATAPPASASGTPAAAVNSSNAETVAGKRAGRFAWSPMFCPWTSALAAAS